MAPAKKTLRIAALGDLHCTVASRSRIRPLLAQIAATADILALCGDLTQTGRVEEAKILAEELAAATLPSLAVFGNHDFESDQQEELRRLLASAGVTLLDGQAAEVCGIGFAGVKGFGGGFYGKMLIPWGEPLIKQFAQTAIDEAKKLDLALSQLHTPQRVALLHYAPIRATVVGESPEIFPFCGSSHLEPPLNRHRLTAVLHGHAHHGCPEGRTRAGVPVYNVSEPLMQRLHPAQPFRLLQMDLAATPATAG